MREIKFRAKTATTDSWVYGHYAFVDGFHVMYEGTSNPVIIKLNTLGQYTGLKDVNGVEIYDGDVLDGGHLHVVEWDDEKMMYVLEVEGFSYSFSYSEPMHDYNVQNVPIVGNVFEKNRTIRGERQ